MKPLILILIVLLTGCQSYYGSYRISHGQTSVDLQTLRAAKITISRTSKLGECETLSIEPGGLDAVRELAPIVNALL